MNLVFLVQGKKNTFLWLSQEKKLKVGGAKYGNDSYTTESSVNKEKIDLISEDIKFIKTSL